MSNVITFPRHKMYRCPGHHEDGQPCMYCDGGLSFCTSCGGAEGSLPHDCPQQRMTDELELAVYRGQLDYRLSEGGWTEWTWEKRQASKGRVT